MLSLGNVHFVFAVAPSHPLAHLQQPLTPGDILGHRAVLAADSARQLPPRTTGLKAGPDRLTVPSVRAKVAAQVAGLGVGYLPTHIADPEIAAGRLVARAVAEPKPSTELFAAWHNRHVGKAMEWFIEQLGDGAVRAGLLG